MTADTHVTDVALRPHMEVQLKRYHRGFRRRLRKFAGAARSHADLVYTFPGLAIFLATGQGAVPTRRAAIIAVAEGAALRNVASAAGLPYWLRKVPPEAFVERVPPVPASDGFARCIVNFVPDDVGRAAMWLQWLVTANQLAGEEFALWVAGHVSGEGPNPGAHCLWPLAAYAWYSGADGTEARGLINRRWTPHMTFVRAVEETRGFILRIILDECRERTGRDGRWFIEQRASGYRFVPLRTLADLDDEGREMDNCVATYAEAVARGDCLIYGIRRGHRHVATLEVRAHWGQNGAPMITQLLGPSNAFADDDVQRAAQKWVSRQGRFPVTAPQGLQGRRVDSDRWNSLWDPFWTRVGYSARHREVPVPVQLAHVTASLSGLLALAKLPHR